MKQRNLLCLLLSAVLLLTACSGSGGEPAKKEVKASSAPRSELYGTFTQPGLTLDSAAFSGQNALCAMRFDGVMGQRITNLMNNWMYTALYSNSGMLERFRQRESALTLSLTAWYGEFPGKYLTGIARLYALNRDDGLLRVGNELVEALAGVQGEDGYLGVFSAQDRMLGAVAMDINGSVLRTSNWDIWNHYHILRGLLSWHEQTGNQTALSTATAAADFIIDYFSAEHTLSEVQEADKNLSCVSAFVQLYTITDAEKYLDFSNAILAAWQGANGGDFLREGLAGTPYTGLRQKRWETMHALLGLAEVWRLNGDESCRSAFLSLFESLRACDRHNSGGMMSGEQAIGSPYRSGSVETCASVAWLECCCAALEMTGDSHLADELELTTLNALLGAQAPSGRNVTYSTPDDGVRLASAIELSFQAVPGSPELNCCSVSAPIGFGMLSKWAVRSAGNAVTVNYYGAGTAAVHTPSGGKLLLTQETQYPRDGAVKLTLESDKEEEFTLRLRIPAWAKNSTVSVNGSPVDCAAGTYCEITRAWKSGDEISLSVDMAVHFWAGEETRSDYAAIYYGPVLLAYDERFNDSRPAAELKAFSPRSLSLEVIENTSVPSAPEPILLLRMTLADGSRVVLCDFATAGQAGTNYISWLPVADASVLQKSNELCERWLAVAEGA